MNFQKWKKNTEQVWFLQHVNRFLLNITVACWETGLENPSGEGPVGFCVSDPITLNF